MTTEPPPVRRPRRLWIGLSAAVVLVGLLAAAAVAVAGGQPDFRPNGACCARPSAESPYVGGPLVNGGPLAVRVTAIEGPSQTEVLVAPAGIPGTAEAAEPFAPFDLEPGASRDVFVRATVPGCSAEAIGSSGALGSSSVRIEYRRFGIDRSTVVEADEMGTLFVADTPDGPCAYLEEGGR